MPSLSPALLARSLLALAVPLALSACGAAAPRQEFPPVCPQLALLKDGADVTRFSPRGHDVTDLILDGRLTAVPATCGYGPRNTVSASLKVTMDLRRGPAAGSRELDVPYFIAVSHAGEVVDKQIYAMHAVFPPNVDHITVTSEPVNLLIPATEAAPAASYQIFVSFQLSPAELQMNRTRGGR